VKFSTRELVLLAVFGALWGGIEISLGTVLKSLNIPLSGAVLAAVGVSIAMIGRLFVPRKGTILFIGAIATLLKLFSLGGVIIGPMIGILSEALIAELVLSLMGKPSRLSFIIAGGFAVLWTLVQPFITGPLLYGRSIFVVWLDLLDRGRQLLGISTNTIFWLLLGFVGLHFLLGSAAGLLAWSAGQRLEKRVGVVHA